MSSSDTAFWKLIHEEDSALLQVPALRSPLIPNHQMISIWNYSDPTFCNLVNGDEGKGMGIKNLDEEMGIMVQEVQLETLHISRVCAATI